MFFQTKPLVGIAAFALFTAATPASAATLLQYDFAGTPGGQGTQTASFVAGNIDAQPIARTNLLANDGARSFNSSGWNDSVSFLTFGLTVDAGYSASLTSITFGARSSNTGPGFLSLLASVDGGAFASVGSIVQNGTTNANYTFDLTGLTALSSIAFRIAPTNQTSASGGTVQAGGTFRIQNPGTTNTTAGVNPFTITGDVTLIPVALVPEPATWAMMIAGIGLAGGALRRRQRVAVRFA
jgi:hypothetical protein